LSYLARESLRDIDTGKLCRETKKNDLVDAYAVTPKGCGWAADLQAFANEISEADKRKNSRFGRELLLICPDGMDPQTFQNVLRVFSFWLSGSYNTVPFVFIHDPKGDQVGGPPEKGRNLHAHIFLPTREMHPLGMGNKLYMLDYNKISKDEVEGIREHWARELERGFTQQNEEVEFDHRSYERCGIKKEAQPKIGNAAYAMDLRGEETDRMRLLDAVQNHNAHLRKIEDEEKALESEIERLENLQNLPLPKSCVGTHVIDDHVNQCSYFGTHVRGQRTYDWLTENHGDEPMLESLFDDFELLLDGPRPEEEKIPELPPNPTIGDLFEAVSMQIDRMELRTRPRPQYARKSKQKQGRQLRTPAMVGLDR
jgi:hypothetical protein